MIVLEQKSDSPEETAAVAKTFAATLKTGDIVLLKGDLGAGKTCFTSGLVEAFGISSKAVSSPTFSIMNRYDGTLPVFHFDLYRIKNEREARDAGVEEFVGNEGISIVEWPEMAGNLIQPPFFVVELRHEKENVRNILISKNT